MSLLLTILSTIAVAVVALPIVLLFLECTAALFTRKVRAYAPDLTGADRPRIAVIIPAHDEEILVASTVESIHQQLNFEHGDRLIVVADNCTDATAERSRAAGATVVERFDSKNRGKGHALAFGVDQLRADPPDVLIVFDADCTIDNGVAQALANEVKATGHAVQAEYVLKAEPVAGAKSVVSSLAFLMKNVVRPSGLDALGLPVPLTGTGMAFPWRAIADAKLASGNLVEDMQMSVDLLRRGFHVRFFGGVRIEGALPHNSAAAMTQRTRWEHGHLNLIRRGCLPLLRDGIRQISLSKIVSAFDLAIPPLALLAVMWMLACGLSLVTAIVHHSFLPVSAAALLGGMFAFSVGVCRYRFAKNLPSGAMLAIPLYVLWKIPMYLKFLRKAETKWVRTAREPEVIEAANRSPRQIKLSGVRLHALTEMESADFIVESLGRHRGGVLVTHNLDHLRRLKRDRQFASVCEAAELRVADGMPLVWASWLQGTPLPERVAGSSLIHTLTYRAADEGFSIFLLGGNPGTAESAAAAMRERCPSLHIAGTSCPPVGFEDDLHYMRQLRADLQASRADIVYVALGSPKQENVIALVRETLPSAWWLGVGISFSFLSGEICRAPQWMQQMGLEWVHRLVQEPRRLAKRYLLQGLPSAVMLLTGAMLRRPFTAVPQEAATELPDITLTH